VVAHPDVRRFDGRTVHFTDGAQVEVDMVVCATGFHVSFPFLPKGLVQVKGAVPQVYGGSMVRGFKHLYMVGWAQPRYGFGPLVTPAAQLLAEMIELQDGCENPLADVLHFAGDRPPSTHLMDPIKTLSKMKRGRRWLRFLPRLDRRLTARSGRAASPAVAMVPSAEVDAVF